MSLAEFFRSTIFRWALAVSGAVALSILLMFAFIYWQSARYMTMRIDEELTREATTIAQDAPEERSEAIEDRLKHDPRRVRFIGEFSPGGARLKGNIESLPPHIDAAGPPASARVVRLDGTEREKQRVRVIARALASGNVLVLGRNIDEIGEMVEILGRTLVLGAFPAVLLALVVGFVLSARAERRIGEVSRTAVRIVAGQLRERLPVRNAGDSFDKLAIIVNGMLDDIETLLHEIAGVGDDIAHDLRTPLTRVRAILERGRENARTLEELQSVTDRAVGGLDQSLAIITALLRITEIEHGHRRAEFGIVELPEIVQEVAEFYAPIAEDRHVQLTTDTGTSAAVRGDRDLLFEAIANLVDNAIKFTPEAGRVDVTIAPRGQATIVRIADTGPGIGEAEREVVTKRFYRSDKSRHTQGVGLGLSLVAAILKLHGFEWTIGGSPGCVVEIACLKL
ncbi:MAG TPA: ATP-binding protein [Stellaceae bacterium]|nr:ATP-binding protein [Stellaceae bacterium]